MDERVFRDAMGKFATGITVVTTEYKNEILGMTVSAFMSVSLNPKLIAVSIGENADIYKKLQQTKKFGVSILTDEQQELSVIFSKKMAEVDQIEYCKLDHIPVIKDSLVTLSCRVQDMVKAGDHMIFIAEVTNLSINKGKPILYTDGDYRSIMPKDTL